MTANDYANIQRMIDQSILAAIGRALPLETAQPDQYDERLRTITPESSPLRTTSRTQSDTSSKKIQDQVSELQHQINQLESTQEG